VSDFARLESALWPPRTYDAASTLSSEYFPRASRVCFATMCVLPLEISWEKGAMVDAAEEVRWTLPSCLPSVSGVCFEVMCAFPLEISRAEDTEADAAEEVR